MNIYVRKILEIFVQVGYFLFLDFAKSGGLEISGRSWALSFIYNKLKVLGLLSFIHKLKAISFSYNIKLNIFFNFFMRLFLFNKIYLIRFEFPTSKLKQK